MSGNGTKRSSTQFVPSLLALTAGSWSYLNGGASILSGKGRSFLARSTAGHAVAPLDSCPHHHHHHLTLHHHHAAAVARGHPLKSRAYTCCLILFLLTFLVAVRLIFLEHPTDGRPVCADPRHAAHPPVRHRLGESPLSTSVSNNQEYNYARTTNEINNRKNSISPQQQQQIPNNSKEKNVRFPRTKRRLPQCLIIGVRKCGTRALLEFMDLHPGIQKSPVEIHFFNKNDKFKLGLEWYRRKMPFSFPGQITVEKTPAYFTTESVPERVKAMNASVKLILIVRDPVTRLISDYVQILTNKRAKNKTTPPFEEMVLLPDDGTVDISFKAVRTSIYILYFRRWLTVFNRSQILVVDGDNFVRNPYPELRTIENFLGLTNRINEDSFLFNKTKGFYCIRNDTADKCLSDTKGRKHPEISRQLLGKLRLFYAPYNRDFYKAVGHDFGWPEV